MNKKDLRKMMLEKLQEIDSKSHIYKSKSIINKLFDSEQYKSSKDIFVFVSFKNEINTHEFINRAINDNKNVYVPIIDKANKLMNISKLTRFEDLESGYFGVLEPSKESIDIVDPNILDLVITPGLIFNTKGYRIGYGAGFYDKFFSSLNTNPTKIGICFEEQIMDFENDDYDIPVDLIINDKSTINIK